MALSEAERGSATVDVNRRPSVPVRRHVAVAGTARLPNVIRPIHRIRHQFTTFVERHGVAWELAMAALAVIYVVVAFIDDNVDGQTAAAIGWVEGGLTVLFGAEFVIRFLAVHKHRAYLRGHWIDLISLIPYYKGLRIARLLRVFPLFRVFAGMERATGSLGRLADHRGITTLLFALIGTTLLSSAAFYEVERGANANLQGPGDALWWGITTLTGGSSNILPMTAEGKIAASILLLVGVALFTGITATFVTFMMADRQAKTELIDRSTGGLLARLATLREDGIITPTEFDVFAGRVWQPTVAVAGSPIPGSST